MQKKKRNTIQRRWLTHVYKQVALASKRGEIPPQPCSVCGSAKRVHGHHASYEENKILKLSWLCALHHKAIHKITTPKFPTDETIYKFFFAKQKKAMIKEIQVAGTFLDNHGFVTKTLRDCDIGRDTLGNILEKFKISAVMNCPDIEQ